MKLPTLLGTLVASLLALEAAEPRATAAQEAASKSATLENAAKTFNRRAAQRSGRDWLTSDAIAQSNASNAYELVSRLRGEWLRPRGVSTLRLKSGIRVYLGHMELGGIESLRGLNVTMIDSMQFLGGPAATQRFGTNHGDGAIVVTPVGG